MYETRLDESIFVHLQMERSNTSQVTIRKVQFIVGGNFSCEITTDAPLFSTASGTKILTVVCKYIIDARQFCNFSIDNELLFPLPALPRDRPTIASERKRYDAGETLRANCTLPMSKPSAQMFFLLNNEQVSEK